MWEWLANILRWLARFWFELALLAIVLAIAALVIWTAIGQVRDGRQLRVERGKVAGLRVRKGRVPNRTTLAHSLVALNEMLDRELKSIEALDRKAALIPTALGVAATILAGQIKPASLTDGRTLFAGIVTMVMGLGAAATSAAVFLPRKYSAGATSLMLAGETDADPLKMDQAVANELAWACVSVKQLNGVKAAYLFLALCLLVGTVVAAVLFGLAGGFTSGTGQAGAAALIGAR